MRRTFDAISNFYNPVVTDNPDGEDDVLKWGGKLWETINEGITITFTKYGGENFESYVKGTVSGTAVSVIPNDPSNPEDDVLGIYTVTGDFITTRGTVPPVVQ